MEIRLLRKSSKLLPQHLISVCDDLYQKMRRLPSLSGDVSSDGYEIQI